MRSKDLAMQSDAITCQSAHTCTENAAEQQQSSSDGASLAEAAQLARRDGVADRAAETEAAAAASRVHGMSKSNTRHSSIKSQPEGCLFALSALPSPPALYSCHSLSLHSVLTCCIRESH